MALPSPVIFLNRMSNLVLVIMILILGIPICYRFYKNHLKNRIQNLTGKRVTVVQNEYRREIESIQNGIDYDPDSSPRVWEYYSKYYIVEHWSNVKYFDFKTLKQYGNRLISQITLDNSEFGRFQLGGETDFNFKEDSSFSANKYRNFKTLLEQANADSKEFDKLELCKRHHHTLVNFSLMARTGGMNNFKGTFKGGNDSFSYDRFDSFIYNLNNFYCDGDSLIVSRKNGEHLARFLSAFEDVYDYCKVFYFIEDRNFVDRIIKEGHQPINTGKDVIRYMNLALDYWDIKEKYFMEHSVL